MARIIWKEGDIVNIKLRNDLYTIGILLVDPYIMLFDLSNTNGEWENIDLDKVPTLFCVLIGRDFLQHSVISKIKKGVKIAKKVEVPKYWLRPIDNYDGKNTWKNAQLIEVDPRIGTYYGKVIQKLVTSKDKEIIKKYELTNMYGSEDLNERLIHYFDTNENIDSLKDEIFQAF
ncbi:MAG: hypothetical protein H0X63_10885 [Flavobacteriales bacterium]|nr:hypothetical protein [Flavobacteriales bacterium]